MTILTPTVAVSLRRHRLIDEMEIRRFGRDTQRNSMRDGGRFATWLGRSTTRPTLNECGALCPDLALVYGCN